MLTSVVDERGQRGGGEGEHRRQRHQNARLLLLGVLVQVKVPDPPVADRRPQLEGGAQEPLEAVLGALVPLLRGAQESGRVQRGTKQQRPAHCRDETASTPGGRHRVE